jgi:hypothetical protein
MARSQMGESDSRDGENQHNCQARAVEMWDWACGFVFSIPFCFGLFVSLLVLCSRSRIQAAVIA